MKNICRKIKLHKYRTELTEDICKETDGTKFLIVYKDNKWELGDSFDVRYALEKDHIRPVYYIFDMNDRITVQKEVIINTDEITKGD